MKILVPVRFPLNRNSRHTLESALEKKQEDDSLAVLHIDLFQKKRNVSERQLKEVVESEFGTCDVSYRVKEGFLVEQSILEEAANTDTDVIYIGESQKGRFRKAVRKLIGNDPNIKEFLRKNIDARIEVVT
ncbi:MAG: universal stress protein [Halobacteria archaeon]